MPTSTDPTMLLDFTDDEERLLLLSAYVGVCMMAGNNFAAYAPANRIREILDTAVNPEQFDKFQKKIDAELYRLKEITT